jgi:hypothetical protein
MNNDRSLNEASQKTADDLRSIAHSKLIRDLTPLTLPEVDAVIDLVSRVVPAGNVPGVILNGLARLPDRRLPLTTVRRDINLLFKGVEQALDRVTYGAFFAGPAAVIWGYQNLLKLVGKKPEDAFPEGTWQFYVEYALRDDTARHAAETHGFDTVLAQHQIQLRPVDRMAAWVMAAIHVIHQYPALLENEWRERLSDSIGFGKPCGLMDAVPMWHPAKTIHFIVAASLIIFWIRPCAIYPAMCGVLGSSACVPLRPSG